MSSISEEFHRRGFVVLEDLLPPSTVQMLQFYCLNYAKKEGVHTDSLVPGTPAGYGHPCMERVLLQLVPAMEAATDRKVFPTYSYFRAYRRGDVLPRHKDRPACELSLSLCLGYRGASDWPLRLCGTEGEVAASLRSGAGVVYKGVELDHWREPFEGELAAQVFLHYVDQGGPYADWRFDKRAGLRLTAETPSAS